VRTDCNLQPIVFSSLKRRAVVGDFAGGSITSDAGALLLREVDRKLGLIDALCEVIPDPRNPALIIHQQRTMLAQRIFAIALGNEDLNDHQHLRDDPLMQVVTERGIDAEQPLASPPTLCRLENRISRKTLIAMSAVLVDTFIRSFQKPPQELVLDFDATDDPVHGNQVGRFFHGYYDGYCFLPLYVFAGDRLLAAYLRPSNIDPSKHTRALLKLLVERLREAWPAVKIIIRGDSGFCRWRLMRWCDRHDIGYILGLARNKVLEKMAEPFMAAAEQAFEQSQQKQRHFHEISYAAGTWDQERRVIIKAERLDQGPNARFVVTNLDDEPRSLYDQRYCQRGEMENRIKEQQLGLFADRTSCHDFLANQFRVLLSAAAYVLIEHLRRTALAGTELQEAQVSTIRIKLLKIGARLTSSVRRIVLHLAGGYPLADLFRRIAARLVPATASG
jgi:Transposase DDE domain group 1